MGVPHQWGGHGGLLSETLKPYQSTAPSHHWPRPTSGCRKTSDCRKNPDLKLDYKGIRPGGSATCGVGIQSGPLPRNISEASDEARRGPQCGDYARTCDIKTSRPRDFSVEIRQQIVRRRYRWVRQPRFSATAPQYQRKPRTVRWRP
jgi:hypothetical protein